MCSCTTQGSLLIGAYFFCQLVSALHLILRSWRTYFMLQERELRNSIDAERDEELEMVVEKFTEESRIVKSKLEADAQQRWGLLTMLSWD